MTEGFLHPAVILTKAPVVHGRNRGRVIGVPTINIDLSAIPQNLSHGIYACRIRFGGKSYNGAAHFGPRPVFKDTDTFEVHIIGETVEDVPDTVDIDIIGFIREVQNFGSTEDLVERIAEDVEDARALLNAESTLPKYR